MERWRGVCTLEVGKPSTIGLRKAIRGGWEKFFHRTFILARSDLRTKFCLEK